MAGERHPAHLRRAHPRAVAGRRLVGAVVGRGQRRSVTGCCAGGCPARPRSPTRCLPQVDDAACWTDPAQVGGGGRPEPRARRAGRRRRRAAARECTGRPRRAPLRPRHRHRLAPYVLLRADPGRRGDRRRDVRARAVGAVTTSSADELAEGGVAARRAPADEQAALPSPMAELPSGAAFGSLVHARARGGRPVRGRPGGGAARPRRGATGLVAGRHPGRGARGRAGPAPPHLARSARRRADPRRDRAARPAARARLRDPAGRRRRRARHPR